MPRQVDHARRRRDIVEATVRVLNEAGTRGLSVRAVASEMGGSTTLVTHYFPTQADLMDAVTAQVLADWDSEIQQLDANEQTPLARLHALLRWLVPLTDDGLNGERTRIHLLAGQLLGEENRAVFQAMDAKVRDLIRSHVEGLVAAQDVEKAVELLRVVTNGVVLSVVEHPDLWPAERQLAVIAWLTESLGIASIEAH